MGLFVEHRYYRDSPDNRGWKKTGVFCGFSTGEGGGGLTLEISGGFLCKILYEYNPGREIVIDDEDRVFFAYRKLSGANAE